jgi:hypothetical protein
LKRNQSLIDTKKCDAEGCDETATKKIEIPAGRFGFVELVVCDNCIEKFLEGNFESGRRRLLRDNIPNKSSEKK